MIKIVKGSEEKVVTKGAYESFYKPLGFQPITVKEKPVESTKPIKDETDYKSEKNDKEKEIVKEKHTERK